jgi:high affinity Mn2+ porin
MVRRGAPYCLWLLAAAVGMLAAAEALSEPVPPLPPATTVELQPGASGIEEPWSLHLQVTVATQAHPAFYALYSGSNSMRPSAEVATSVVGDLFLAARLWPGAAVYFQPEIVGGLGLSTTLGVSAFPSGEVYRVGNPTPNVILARLFLRQWINLGGNSVQVEGGPGQLAAVHDSKVFTLTVGRLAANDQFDNNPVSDDPHTRFDSWGLWESAAWDYPADTHGYDWGLTADLTIDWWSVRAGVFLEPLYANQEVFDWNILRSQGLAAEWEGRWAAAVHPGAARFLVFLNTARMGVYEQAINDPRFNTNVTATRAYGRQKWGFAASVNQELARGLNLFVRVSWDDGATETWAFTEIDSSLAAGVVQMGWRWHRPNDALGVGAVSSLLSNPHRFYLASGGYGYIIGDGALTHYGPETLGEVFYQCAIVPNFSFGGVYQLIVNPAFNRDRGPINVFTLRMQVAF